MTGNLGNVMKESVTIALEYIKAKYEELGMTEEQLTDKTSTFTYLKVLLLKTVLPQVLPC